MPRAIAETTQELLERFAYTIGRDEHVDMILDQTGWRGAGNLRPTPSRQCLSACSPELNPVERV